MFPLKYIMTFQWKLFESSELYKLYMELIGLQDEDLSEFKRLLQESFQYGYENVYGKCEELVLPEKDIDECLKKENTHAYVMKILGLF